MLTSNQDKVMQYAVDEVQSTRRRFLQSGAAATIAALWTGTPLIAFPDAAGERGQAIQFGYSEITWGSDYEQSVQDISAAGFAGIQIRALDLGDKMSSPTQIKATAHDHGLTIVALSSGSVSPEPADRATQVALHLDHARFARDTGCLYLQVVAGHLKKQRAPTPDDYKYMGDVMTEIGRKAADLGLKVSIHNHYGSLAQSPKELDDILSASDPIYLKLELDIAHYTAGGGKPVEAVEKYHDRLLFLHLKDMLPMKDGEKPRFVELGNGIVDISGTMKTLAKLHWHGWAVVELDREEIDPARPPKQSAEISKRYIENTLKLHV